MSDSERTRTTKFIPIDELEKKLFRKATYLESVTSQNKTQVDSWLEVGRLVLKNFQMHEKTQYAEFIFLCLGIVYFIEAIVKNTLEMLK